MAGGSSRQAANAEAASHPARRWSGHPRAVSNAGNATISRFDAVSGQFLDVFAAGGNLTAPAQMLASEGVLYVLNTDTSRVVRYHMATGAALGGPDDFIVPGTSGLASPRYMAFAPPADADADGLPDAWEHTHGLSSANPLDAAQDADGDGQTNLAEYQSGTDPRDPASTPGATALQRDAQGLLLTFRTIPGRFCVLEAKTDLTNPADPWMTIVPNIIATTRTTQVRDPNAATYTQRNYRLRVTGQQQ